MLNEIFYPSVKSQISLSGVQEILVQPGSISFRTSLKCLFTCPGTSLQKVNTSLYLIFDNYDELTCYGENCVDPDQLASLEAS